MRWTRGVCALNNHAKPNTIARLSGNHSETMSSPWVEKRVQQREERDARGEKQIKIAIRSTTWLQCHHKIPHWCDAQLPSPLRQFAGYPFLGSRPHHDDLPEFPSSISRQPQSHANHLLHLFNRNYCTRGKLADVARGFRNWALAMIKICPWSGVPRTISRGRSKCPGEATPRPSFGMRKS